MNKIAMVGTAPGSRALAPFNDSSWDIWTCSPGNISIPRWNVWFEVHTLDQEPFLTDQRCVNYLNWLSQQEGRILTRRPWPIIPQAELLPINKIQQEFAPALLTSTISWMLAYAMTEGPPEEIGIWGVDMASDAEWASQRIPCQALIWEARKRGIKVFIPPESELDAVNPPYGLPKNPMDIKLDIRRDELKKQISQAESIRNEAEDRIHHFQGMIDGIDYVQKTWGIGRVL